MRSRRFACVALLSLVLVAPAAMAWGPLGHAVVAALAWRQLDPTARAEVRKLLASGDWPNLVAVSSWPDEIQDMPRYQQLWAHTRAMHYVDIFDPHCIYKPARQCKDGQCVVAAIEHYEKVLADRSLPDAQRLRALIFVVHFIGDIHQPFHAYGPGKGGNTDQLLFEGRSTELHRVWDSGLLETRYMGWETYTKMLADEGPVQLPPARPGVKPPVQWAEESCRIAFRAVPHGDKIGKAYVRKWRPVAEQRLREGGARLARVLNRILG